MPAWPSYIGTCCGGFGCTRRRGRKEVEVDLPGQEQFVVQQDEEMHHAVTVGEVVEGDRLGVEVFEDWASTVGNVCATTP